MHYVAAQLGHSPALTLSTYGHLIAEYADAGPIDAEQEISKARTDALSSQFEQSGHLLVQCANQGQPSVRQEPCL